MSLAPKGAGKARGKSPGPGGRSPRSGRKNKKKGPAPLGEQLVGLKASQVKPLAVKTSLAWKSALMPDPETTAAVLESDPETLKTLVAEKFELVDCETDAKSATEQDFYVCAVFLAKHNKFTLQEASAAMQVASSALTNLKTDRMALSDNVSSFKKLLAEHSSEEDQHAVADDLKAFKGAILDFQPTSSKLVANFLNTGLFQHYRMYSFLFHGTRPTQIVDKVLSIAVPKPSQPLDEARSQRERLQLEAEAALGTVGMPPLPASLTAEQAQELTAKIVAEIVAGEGAGGAATGSSSEDASEGGEGEFNELDANDDGKLDTAELQTLGDGEGGGKGGGEGEGDAGAGAGDAGNSLNDSLTALTSLTGDAMKAAVDEATNTIALKLLTQIEEEETATSKK